MESLLERILQETELAKSYFDTVFAPATKEEHLKRLGYSQNPDGTWQIGKYKWDPKEEPNLSVDYLKKMETVQNNPDGTWTVGNVTIDPRKRKEYKYPILSQRYSSFTFKTAFLEVIPARATSFTKVIKKLESSGVHWVEFSRIEVIPRKDGEVSKGYQAVGKYKDKIVMLETKIGVSTSSVGYLIFVGLENEVEGSKGVTAANVPDAYQKIVKKLDLPGGKEISQLEAEVRKAKKQVDLALEKYNIACDEEPYNSRAEQAGKKAQQKAKQEGKDDFDAWSKAREGVLNTNPRYKAAKEEYELLLQQYSELEQKHYRGRVLEKFDPGKFPSFVHPAKKRWIQMGDEQLNKLLPTLTDPEKTYLEMITSETYQEMLGRLEKYAGMKISGESLPQLVSLVYQSLQKIVSIEELHKDSLEKLALEVVLDLPEFKMVQNAYENEDVFFDVQLGPAKLTQPEVEPKEELSEAEEMNVELAKEFAEIQDEAELKRRLANLLIQGMATLKMQLFHLVSDKINKIDPSLVNLYGIVSVGIQLGYWITPPGVERSAASSSATTGGSSEVVPKGDEYTITAKGIIFPFLVHELVKGIYEWLSVDPDLKAAMKNVDSIEAETGDIIAGPGFAKRFQTLIPTEKQHFLPLIYRKFLQLPKEDIKHILAQTEEGKETSKRLLQEAEKEWSEYEKEKRDYDFETSQEKKEPEESEENKFGV